MRRRSLLGLVGHRLGTGYRVDVVVVQCQLVLSVEWRVIIMAVVEVEYIWKGWNKVKAIYLLQRYIPLMENELFVIHSRYFH